MAFKDFRFNIIRQRASPTEVILDSGHKVEKQEHVYFQMPNADGSGPGDWMMIKCADYHGEHFVYIDPLYNTPAFKVDPNKQQTGRGHWWAMCTCGGPAVAVGPMEAQLEDSNCETQLLVCMFYHQSLKDYGWGKHADQQGMKQWT